MPAHGRLAIGQLRNATTGTAIDARVERATSIVSRVIGCLKYARLGSREGLWLDPCSAVHTFGMRTSLDVILLDRGGVVVALRPRIRPNHLCVAHPRAKSIIEMGEGFLDHAPIAVGDRLEFYVPGDTEGSDRNATFTV